MVRFILIAILILFVVRALSRLARGILEGAGYQRGEGGKSAVKLVRDPVCGTFVAPTQALAAGAGNETRYFCSEKCRREWKG